MPAAKTMAAALVSRQRTLRVALVALSSAANALEKPGQAHQIKEQSNWNVSERLLSARPALRIRKGLAKDFSLDC
jgi:hypothetical protein